MAPNCGNRSFSLTRKLANNSYRPGRMLNRLRPDIFRSVVLALSLVLTLGNLIFTPMKVSASGAQKINLTATPISQSQIRLSWSIINPGSISTIRIYRADASSPQNFYFLTGVVSAVTGIIDRGLTPGRVYYYQVRTVSGGGVLMSAPSNTASARTSGSGAASNPAPTPAPTPNPTPFPKPASTPTPAPTPTSQFGQGGNTLAAAAISATQIQLTWQIGNTNRLSSIRIYRADQSNPKNFTLLTSASPTPNRFIDSGLAPGTAYYYQIKIPLGGGAVLSPPSNVASAVTLGSGGVSPTPTPRPSPTPTPKPNPTPTPKPNPTPAPTPTPAPPPPGGTSGAIPLDGEETNLLTLISQYRATRGLGPMRPSIAMTKASDFLSRDLAVRGKLSKSDGQGRDAATLARSFGFQSNTMFDSVVAGGNLTAQQALNQWKLSSEDNSIILNPTWKVAGVGRTFNASTGQWYWVAQFAGTWDVTIPIPGEDADGIVDGNSLIRTRPPGKAIAAGHRFTGYADDGMSQYSGGHCDMDDPDRYCWKDEPPQGNPSLREPSMRDNLVGVWHIQYTISPKGVVHYNDFNGWDSTGFTMTFWINLDGTWATKGYRAYQQPTPNESGRWDSIHDASRGEEIVTFYRQNGSPNATIRIHAAKGILTLFAVDGWAKMKSFLQGLPADSNPKDDPQILLKPGMSYYSAPHAPFPGQNRCNTCP